MNIVQVFIKFSLAFLVVLVLISQQTIEARYAAIVVDAESGEVLHSVNADTRNFPASLTKMMTLYMLFEALDQGTVKMHQKMVVSRRATAARPSKLGLRRGETITVEQAIGALVTKSANDIAIVVAEELAGSVKAFAVAMTRRARALGMKRTTFRNPHGLPNRSHLSTARDMALLSRVLIKNFPHHYDSFAAKDFRFRGKTYRNHNKLLGRYTGADGIKTGYTHAAGYNLAASAERGGNRLVAIVFGGRTAKFRDRHVKKLLDKGFAKLEIAQGSRDDSPPQTAARKPKSKKNQHKKVAAVSLGSKKEFYTSKTRPTSKYATGGVKSRAGKAPLKSKSRRKKQDLAPADIAAIEERKINEHLNVEASLPPFMASQANPSSPKEPNARANNAAKTAIAATPTAQKQQEWMIQIGAYYKMDPAVKRASKAAEKLSALGMDYEVAIMTGERNARTIYRARLSGLNRKNAYDACLQLKKLKFDCIPMAPK
jgi:D-alanyl-D-alanine carboxypeptidase